MQNSLILRRHEFNSFQGNNFTIWFKAVAMATSISIAYYLSFPSVKSPFFVYFSIIVICLLGVFFFIRFINKTRVEISDFGIEYRSGLPDIFKKLDPDWKASWGDIQKVSFTKEVMRNSLLTPLQIKLMQKTVKLIPAQWVISNKSEKSIAPKNIFEALFGKKRNYKLLVENSPLIKILEKKGFLKEGVSLEKLESGVTEINSNPIALGMAAIFFVSIFYFVGDVYFGLSEFYIDTPPYLWNVVVGVLIAFLAYLIIKTTKLKFSEKIIMAVLVGFGAALITYPLLLRANEWTDTGGLQSYSYKLAEKGVWMAEQKNTQLPDLTFDLQISDYWDQFKIGAIKDFELRKGGLGFYQLNMKPIYEEQREFYHNEQEVFAESIK